MPERDHLTTIQAARTLGVSAATVKRWAETGALRSVRTVGGHRRFERADVESMRGAAEGGPPPPAGPVEFVGVVDPSAAVSAWIDRLLAPHPPLLVDAALLGERARLGGWADVATLLGEVLDELGRRWAAGALSVLEEHVAANRLLRAIGGVADAFPARPGAPTVLLATLEGERHTIGLALAELCFREAGWPTVFAGGGVPLADLERRLAHDPPAVVALSASVGATGQDLADVPDRLDRAARGRSAIVLGGRGPWPEPPPAGRIVRTFDALRPWIARFDGRYAR